MSVELLPLGAPLRVEVRGVMPPRAEAVADCWAEACANNERLFDGPILSVGGIDAGAGRVWARPDRFSHVVCPPPGRSLPATILSVTGVIEASAGGEGCVLLARRGASTRSYPGMWEFAPAGGLHVPEEPGSFGLGHVMQTLAAELAEEVGVTAALHGARAVALVADAGARSVDVVVRATIDGPAPRLAIAGAHAWECAEARWVAVAGLAEFFERVDGGVIEPTMAIARHLGWL